jgi:hypothetical protein
MKKQELFNKTVGILVKAYQNETLEHLNCRACAVGNICAASAGVRLIKKDFGVDLHDNDFDKLELVKGWFYGRDFEHSGYEIHELYEIESAFEYTQHDKDGFLGLMSVVDTLMLIHEATTEEATEAKSLFVLSN